MNADIVPSKICKTCKTKKPLSEFYKGGKSVRYQCKVCTNIKNAEWAASNKERLIESRSIYYALNTSKMREANAKWYLANISKARAYSAAHYISNKEKKKAQGVIWRADNKADINAKRAAYYAANKEKSNASSSAYRASHYENEKARSVAYRAANRESCNAATAAWMLVNPEKVKIYGQNRRARKIASGGKLSQGLSAKLFKLQRGKCACCGLPLGDNFHLDHIYPLVLGGSNIDSNIQLLRQRCNNQKSAKDPVDFMQSRGFLI